MPQKFEYRLISGGLNDMAVEVAKAALDNWKPTLLSSCALGNPAPMVIQAIIILERPLGG